MNRAGTPSEQQSVPPVSLSRSASFSRVTPHDTARDRSRPQTLRRPMTAVTVVTAPVSLDRFGSKKSFLNPPPRDERGTSQVDESVAQLEALRLVAPSRDGFVDRSLPPTKSFVLVRPGSALSQTTRDINASVGDVWSVVRSEGASSLRLGVDRYVAVAEHKTQLDAGNPSQSVKRRGSSAATWRRLSTRGNSFDGNLVEASAQLVMPLEKVRQLQTNAEARRVFMKSITDAQEAARHRPPPSPALSASPVKLSEPEISLSGDATLAAMSAAATFFQRATDVRHVAEKVERERGVRSRQQLSMCTKLVRTVEDLERPQEVQALRVRLTEVDIRRNSWNVMVIIATLNAEIFSRFLREMWQCSSLRASQINSSPASYALRAICTRRTQWQLQRTGKYLWRMWMVFRPRVRRRRKTTSIDLIHNFIGAIKKTTRVVVAISHFLKTIRRVQAHVKCGRAMRAIRVDMAHRQVLRGITRSQERDTAKIAQLKEEFERREAEILSKKTGTRVTKSVKIAELRADLDQDLSRLCRRSSPENIDTIMKNEKILMSIVDEAVARRLDDYKKQLTRYARAVVRYIEEMNDLRRRGIISARFRRARILPAQHLLAKSSWNGGKEPLSPSKKAQSTQRKDVQIPQPPVRPYFLSLFSLDEIQQHIDDTLDELGVQ